MVEILNELICLNFTCHIEQVLSPWVFPVEYGDCCPNTDQAKLSLSRQQTTYNPEVIFAYVKEFQLCCVAPAFALAH